jgi:hypothetical protein
MKKTPALAGRPTLATQPHFSANPISISPNKESRW